MYAHDRPAIVCLAHLDWDFVWQRPQHILSRLAQRYPVAYIQEPAIDPASSAPHLRTVVDQDDLAAWQPLFPDSADVLERWREIYSELVQDLLIERGWARRHDGRLVATRPLIVWFYTPLPVYLLDQLPAALVVYDAMDELSNFKGAPADLSEREARLLEHADLVLTGGRGLYEARKHRHAHVFCFPSGVDAAHFAQALSPTTAPAAEIAGLPRPRLGYYGVVDERLDLELLATLARRRPRWSIAIVGPVAKIAAAQLPRAANLHYIGRQPYERLPSFLAGFDVCLMPFAINAATRFISPTKTLEYMAAHKPIVSTPVPDVVANWSDVVRIAGDAAQFISAAERALGETPAQRAQRAAREAQIVARGSWDRIAEEIGGLLAAELARRGEGDRGGRRAEERPAGRAHADAPPPTQPPSA